MKAFRILLLPLLLFLLTVLLLGCARGLVKEGPTGESGKGIGLKIPVMGFTKKEAYDAENLSPDNLREEALNPFQSARDIDPITLEDR